MAPHAGFASGPLVFASLLLGWFQWFARPRGLRAAVFRSSWLLAWLGRLLESITPLRERFEPKLHADNSDLASINTLASITTSDALLRRATV
jgi:hypothetical protein